MTSAGRSSRERGYKGCYVANGRMVEHDGYTFVLAQKIAQTRIGASGTPEVHSHGRGLSNGYAHTHRRVMLIGSGVGRLSVSGQRGRHRLAFDDCFAVRKVHEPEECFVSGTSLQ